MAINQFNLPDLGEGLTEGEILKWLVNEGDVIELNQPIVEVETAKAAVEIPAKWAGTVVKIFHPEGATVEVGHPIISIDTAGDCQNGTLRSLGRASNRARTSGWRWSPAATTAGSCRSIVGHAETTRRAYGHPPTPRKP